MQWECLEEVLCRRQLQYFKALNVGSFHIASSTGDFVTNLKQIKEAEK